MEWFNTVDATYRADLRELNEVNFARFDAKLEQRLAELRAELRAEFHREIAELRGELRGGLAGLKTELRNCGDGDRPPQAVAVLIRSPRLTTPRE